MYNVVLFISSRSSWENTLSIVWEIDVSSIMNLSEIINQTRNSNGTHKKPRHIGEGRILHPDN